MRLTPNTTTSPAPRGAGPAIWHVIESRTGQPGALQGTLCAICIPLFRLMEAAHGGREDATQLLNELIRRLWCIPDAGVDVGNDIVAEDGAALFTVHAR